MCSSFSLPQVYWFFSNKNSISGTEVATGATTWLSLQQSIVILQDLSGLWEGQHEKVNWDIMGTIGPLSFKYLANSHWDNNLITKFNILAESEISFRGFHVAFSTMISLASQIMKLMWKFWQLYYINSNHTLKEPGKLLYDRFASIGHSEAIPRP